MDEEQYTVPSVREEIRGNSMAWIRFRMATESGKLKVRMPQEAFTEKARVSAIHVGDSYFLSEADLQVLGLAFELKTQGYSPIIATDDYSIQNVANQMGIKFSSLATFGIRFRLRWIRYCPACHKKYPADYEHENCYVCGTPLKRKPLARKKA